MRPPRLILWPITTLLILALGTLVAVGLAIGSEPGLRFAVQQLLRVVPGQLSIAEIRGTLLGSLQVSGVRYRDAKGMRVSVERVTLKWHPLALLRRQVDIQALEVAGLDFTGTHTPPEQEAPFTGLPTLTLPVELVVHHAALQEARITPAPGEPPVVISRLLLVGRWNAQALHVETLEMRTPEGQARVSGKLQPAGSYPMDLALTWSATLPDYPLVQGAGALSGDLHALTLAQRISGALQAHLAARLTDVLAKPNWDVTLDLQALRPHMVNPRWPKGLLVGRLESRGSLDMAHARLDLRLSEAPALHGPWNLSASVAGNQKNVRLEKLSVTRPEDPFQIRLHGQAELAGESTRVTLDGHWQEVAWPPRGAAQVHSKRGSLHLEGTPRDYQYQVQAELGGEQIPPGTWELSGTGSEHETTIAALHGSLLGGELQAQGRASWTPALEWDVSLRGAGLDPGRQWPEWPGNLALEIRSRGGLVQGEPDYAVDVARVEGTLRDRPVAVHGELHQRGSTFALKDVELSSGAARLRASGEVGAAWSLTWNLTAPDLKDLYPELGGRLEAQGTMAGKRLAPRLTASLSGQRLGFQTQSLASLRMTADVALSPGSAADLEVQAKGLKAAGQALDEVTLALHGRVDRHRLQLRVRGPGEALTLAAAGGYGDERWRGTLDTLSLESRLAGQWRLAAPVAISAAPLEGRVAPICLSREAARLCAEGQWQGIAANGQLRLAALPLAWLAPLLPADLKVEGTVNAEIEASRNGPSLTGQLQVTPSPGTLTYRTDDDRQVRVSYRQGQIAAQLDAESLAARVQLELSEGGSVSATAHIPRQPLEANPASAPLSGELQARVTALGLLPAFVPALAETSGALQAQLSLSGTLGQPRVAGDIALREGVVAVPVAGIKIKNLHLTARSTGDERLQLSGGAHSGPGDLKLSGEVQLDPAQGFPAQIKVTGQNFQVVDLPEAQAQVSPDLTIKTGVRQVDVQGSLTIPAANLAPREIPASAQEVSPDVVVVGQQASAAPAPTWKLDTVVRLILGDKVRFKGFGLKARFGGQILIRDEAGRPPIGVGELRIEDGTYKAYGQDLTIRRGRLVFASGPLDNPGLDIQGVRTVDDTVAGANVRGTLKQPRLTVFSEPAMDQADALSYLLTGHALGKGSSGEGELLLQAAASAGLARTGMLTEEIKKTFGLEELSVQRGSTLEETSLLLGKYLTPRLYVGYGVGLFGAQSEVKVRYKVNKNWVVESTSGAAGSGADILYTIEVR